MTYKLVNPDVKKKKKIFNHKNNGRKRKRYRTNDHQPGTIRNVIAWFAIMEAQFSITNIKQARQKFYHLLAALPPEIVGRITTNILRSKDYDTLKEAVNNAYKNQNQRCLTN